MIVNRFPDNIVKIDGKEFLYFGGTAYLGLPTNINFQNTLIESVKKWGSFYGSSRQSNIKLSVYEETENKFAKQIGAEKTVITSSGTLAGKMVIEYLSNSSKNTFYHYPKTHPAILHSKSVPLFVNGKLHKNLLNNIKEDIVITADAVLALEVEATNFDFINTISTNKQITIVLDESHSIGILGANGFGIYKSILKKNIKRTIMVASLGKALGLSGGIIASDRVFIENIKNESLFVSSSCANPAYLESYLLSQQIIENQQNQLKDNLKFLFKDLKPSTTLKFNKNYPVIYSDAKSIYNHFLEQGIIITNFKYPNYDGFMSRIVITANHTKADLTKLKQVMVSL